MNVGEIFETMEYGPAPEAAEEALAWIVDQGGRFGHFINGTYSEPGETFETCNPANGDVLAELTQASARDVDLAVKAARAAQAAWADIGGAGRARGDRRRWPSLQGCGRPAIHSSKVIGRKRSASLTKPSPPSWWGSRSGGPL